VVTGALLIVQASSLQYAGWDTALTAVFLVPALLFAAALLVTEAIEWGCSVWRRDRRVTPSGEPPEWPRVSIHVPIHNEPPDMVLETLAALARLDYPDFEVAVIDNNTADPALWRPVRARCRALGPRFRFVHVEGLAGFKAGALNRALRMTDPAATLVAVIDSDYRVERGWLRTAVPPFVDPTVAIVQAPQDYRDGGDNLFKSLCYEEYATFFHVGMVERSEHNAIVQHGTMCVVRRDALEAVGGWAEWCIT
jgi:cellulose synthase/poly-beta-1,6-N-acetylglucosamine synthase-like glycosyltransferase